MNRENLLRAAEYIKTIPQEKFNMNQYRESDDFKSVCCNSVGCSIGWSTCLFPNQVIWYEKEIDFPETSDKIFKLTSQQWGWCFHSLWTGTDNTPKGAYQRIKYLLDKRKVPSNWGDQMRGRSRLTYTDIE